MGRYYRRSFKIKEIKMRKVAIILLASTESDECLGRALHSMIYAHELTENGDEVKLIFDGAGVRWITKILSGSDDPASKAFAELAIGTYSDAFSKSVCKFCSSVFHVPEADVERAGFDVSSDGYSGHPDIAGLIERDFQIITL